MKKRDLYIETMLREVETGATDDPVNIAIYYEDLTSEGREKVLNAINGSDKLLNIFGDDVARQAVEDALFGNNGKDAVPLFILDADKLRSSVEV